MGDADPDTGRTFTGPPAWARLTRGERVIVDEAGMLDQDTALALLTVTTEAGATVALVGDRAQLPAVGRGGVLHLAAAIRGRTYDMAEVHRSTDPDYAALTLAMRDGGDPAAVFDQLAALDLVRLHADDEALREHIATTTEPGEAVTTATNDEATAINERIRAERVTAGLVNDDVTTTVADGLPIGAGDVIQTRRNDTTLGVVNRQTWTVQQVENDGTVWATEQTKTTGKPRTVRLPAEYVAEHAHLSYAATAYGVQGATVTGSRTILSDAASGAGVYVGMTRGRAANLLHVVAADLAGAREQFIDAMRRDRADRGLDHATAQAVEAVAGLTAHGPVKLVTEHLTALTKRAEDAERRAARWGRIAARLTEQQTAHRAEDDHAAAVLHAAREHAEQVHAAIVAPLTAEATEDGRAYLSALTAAETAERQERAASVFTRPAARKAHRAARENAERLRAAILTRWGQTPYRGQDPEKWATTTANQTAERAPELVTARAAVQTAEQQQRATAERHGTERRELLEQVYGAERVRRDPIRWHVTDPTQKAATWAQAAEQARTEADTLRALTPAEAVARIEAAHAAEVERQRRAAERAARMREQQRQQSQRSPWRDPSRGGPSRDGYGRSL